MPGHARYQAIEILRAMQRGDRVQVGMMRDQELFAARSAHPLLDWDSWTKREAERGDPEAARVVERRQAREREGGLERLIWGRRMICAKLHAKLSRAGVSPCSGFRIVQVA